LARSVTLSGYVIRLDGGELALDVPYWEKGAVRYLLTGTAAEALAPRLPAGSTFPTDGGIRSDGDTTSTLRSALGGGGSKHSDVRFSRLAAQLTGQARLVSVIDPEVAEGEPAKTRDAALTDRRLPYGGSLYTLEVSDVRWVVDQDRWQQLTEQSKPDLRKAWAHVRAGALDDAAMVLARQATALASAFPGARVPFAEQLRDVSEALTLIPQERGLELPAMDPGLAGDLVIGVRCDRGADVAAGLDRDDPLLARLFDELDVCRRTRYRAVLAKGPEPAKELVAGRLMFLFAAGWSFDNPARLDMEKKIESLRMQFPTVQVSTQPPSLLSLAP
jgi:hypothetical protein